MAPGAFLGKAISTPEYFKSSSVKMRSCVLIGKGDRIQHFAHCEKSGPRMSSLVPAREKYFAVNLTSRFCDEAGEHFGGPEQPGGFS